MQFLGIAGSLRKESHNRALLRAAIELLPENVAMETFGLTGVPLFNRDEERKPPPKVIEMKTRIVEADTIVFATAEYNYSISGVLKNAID